MATNRLGGFSEGAALTMPRNRIHELRTVRAGSLKADPRNWRKHPKAQREAFQAMLDRVGWVDAVIARETPDGLILVDGRLRADLDANAEVPVLVVDLDEDEAGQVLATLDPLAAMPEANTEALKSLVDSIAAQTDQAMAAVLEDVHSLVPEVYYLLAANYSALEMVTFVESMMGFPENWTESKSSAMP